MALENDPKRDRPRKSSAEKPAAKQEDVEAYELDEPEPEAPAKSKPSVDQSYLMDSQAPAAPSEEGEAEAKKKPKRPSVLGAPPPKVKEVDPYEAATKREESRKQGAEMWAAQEAARKKKMIITAATVLGLAIVAYLVFFR